MLCVGVALSGSPVGFWIAFAVFCLSGIREKFFVERARLIVLFHVGLARLFVGVVLSEFPVGLPFFFERRYR
jgi:hypothetical protein